MRPSMICPQRNGAAAAAAAAANEAEEETTMATTATASAEDGKQRDLDDSILTTPTEMGSVSTEEDDGAGWLGDFKTLAKSLKDTAGGVADFVHSAAVAAAQEFQVNYGSDDEDQLDADHEREQLRLPWEVRQLHNEDDVDHEDEENENSQTDSSSSDDDNHDSSREPTYQEDLLLKEKIEALSAKEDTFLKPFTAEMVANEERFLDKPRIELVNRILQVDEQLRATHARLSGRSSVQETVFWRNYFYHCNETRKIHVSMYHCDIQDDGSESSSSLVPANTDDEQNDDDVENAQGVDDDSSFVKIPSPPASNGILSIDSMVMVDKSE